jgi:hypothetical protein
MKVKNVRKVSKASRKNLMSTSMVAAYHPNQVNIFSNTSFGTTQKRKPAKNFRVKSRKSKKPVRKSSMDESLKPKMSLPVNNMEMIKQINTDLNYSSKMKPDEVKILAEKNERELKFK